jgi:hypothetical protein
MLRPSLRVKNSPITNVGGRIVKVNHFLTSLLYRPNSITILTQFIISYHDAYMNFTAPVT